MYVKNTKIVNRSGLHARPASDFVTCARKFQSKIRIKRAGEDNEVDAKSIVMLLSLGLSLGEEVVIGAQGEDEVGAVDALIRLVDSAFGEG